MTRFRLFILCLSLVLFRVVPVEAQYTTASLGGSVSDASGAAIPEAQITARNVDTGFTQTTTTDSSGGFLFSRLPIGNYELRCEKSGFSVYQQTGIRLDRKSGGQPANHHAGRSSSGTSDSRS